MHRPHYIYACLYVYTYVCMNCEFVSSRHSICVCPSVCVQTMSLQMRMQLCASVPYLCQCVVCRPFYKFQLRHGHATLKEARIQLCTFVVVAILIIPLTVAVVVVAVVPTLCVFVHLMKWTAWKNMHNCNGRATFTCRCVRFFTCEI